MDWVAPPPWNTQPNERLTQMIHGLHELGFHKIAVMDDGSSDD